MNGYSRHLPSIYSIGFSVVIPQRYATKEEPMETPEEVVSEPSPAELYDALVQGNEKQGTKNQQQRYGKNKSKKNKRRH